MMFLPNAASGISRLAYWVDRRGWTRLGIFLRMGYVRLRPKDPRGWIVWSRVFMNRASAAQSESEYRENVGEAMEIIGSGLSRAPGSRDLEREFGEVLTWIGGDEAFEEAEAILDRLQQADPDWAAPYFCLAVLAHHQRDRDGFLSNAEAFARRASLNQGGDEWVHFREMTSYLCEAALGPLKSERSRVLALEMIHRMLATGRRANWLVYCGLLLEDADPDGADRFLSEARSTWPSADPSLGSFSEFVATTRESLITAGEWWDAETLSGS